MSHTLFKLFTTFVRRSTSRKHQILPALYRYFFFFCYRLLYLYIFLESYVAPQMFRRHPLRSARTSDSKSPQQSRTLFTILIILMPYKFSRQYYNFHWKSRNNKSQYSTAFNIAVIWRVSNQSLHI